MKADVQKIKNPDKEITDVVKAVLLEAVDTVAKKVLVNGRLNHRQQFTQQPTNWKHAKTF